MTAEEIKRLSPKAKKALQKRDAKYAKYELAEVYIVNAKVKKTRNTHCLLFTFKLNSWAKEFGSFQSMRV